MKKKTKVLLGAAAIVVLYAGCAGSKKENPAMVQQAVSRTDEKQERETSQSEKKPEESKPVQPVQEEKKEPAASQEQTLQPEPAVQDSGIRPEFKEAVDTYVTFYEEYAEFMQRYAANPSDMGLLMEMTSWLQRVEEMDEKFDAFDNDESDWTYEEAQYFIDASAKIQKLMIEAAASM